MLKATNVKQCLAIDVPAFVAFYRAAQDFGGADEFQLEVTFSGGRKEIQNFHVSAAGANAARAFSPDEIFEQSKHQPNGSRIPAMLCSENIASKYFRTNFALICSAARAAIVCRAAKSEIAENAVAIRLLWSEN